MPANPISPGSLEWLGAGRHAIAYVPADGAAAFMPTRRIICTAGGVLTCRFTNSAADVVIPVTAGVEYQWSVIAVRATGTTATGVVLIY